MWSRCKRNKFIHCIYFQRSITWFFAITLIINVALGEKKASGECKHCRNQKARQHFYQSCNCSLRSYSVKQRLNERCKRSCCYVIQSRTTTVVKLEHWIWVLTITTITAMSPCTICCQTSYMWLRCQQSPPWTALSILDEDLEQSQAVCLANSMCCLKHIYLLKDSVISQVPIKSSPHSYQGRDLPFH